MVVNVAFNISDPLRSKIIKLSTYIRDTYGSDWWVDEKRYCLHLPVYLFECPEHNRKKIIQTSKRLVKFLKKIEVTVVDLSHSESGLLMINFTCPKELYEYHLKALELFNPLREGMLREKYRDEKYMKTLSKKDRKKLKKYGHRWVLDTFHPHITISRLADLKLLDSLIHTYRKDLINQKAYIEKLQVHEAVFGKDDYTKVIFKKELY